MSVHLSHKINWDCLKNYVTPYNSSAISFPCCSCNMAHISNKKQLIQVSNRKYIDSNITSMDKSRLLEFMQKLSTLSNKLIEAIILWSKDIHVQNNDVTNKLISLKNEIISQNEMNEAKKKRYSVEMYDTSGQEKIKINRDTDINNLLLLIIGRLQTHEASKKRRISGGTRKHKTRSKKNTRRRRK